MGWGSLHPSSSGFALNLGTFLVQQEGLGLSSGTAAGGRPGQGKRFTMNATKGAFSSGSDCLLGGC